MPNNAVVIYEQEYFGFKENYIFENYKVTNLIAAFDTDAIGSEIRGIAVTALADLPRIKRSDKYIIAMRPDSLAKKIIQLLLKLGVDSGDVVLLYNAPDLIPFERFDDRFNGCINYYVSADGEIICKINGYLFVIDDILTFYIIEEVIMREEYNFFMPFKDVVLIDIGLNVGIASVYLAKKENIRKIYAYEPFSATFEYAKKNISINKLGDKVFAYRYGLGNKNCVLEAGYDENNKGNMGTVFDNSIHVGKELNKSTVEIRDAAEVFAEIIKNEPQSIFVFKIDCEGAEYDILERLSSTGLIDKIKIIVMEWHAFYLGMNLSLLTEILTKHNFICHVYNKNFINKEGVFLNMPTSGMIFASRM